MTDYNSRVGTRDWNPWLLIPSSFSVILLLNHQRNNWQMLEILLFWRSFWLKKKKKKTWFKGLQTLFLCIYIHGSLSAGRHLCLWDTPFVITSKPVVMFYGRKMFSKHLYYLISQDVLWKIFVNASIRRCSLNWNSAWKYLKIFCHFNSVCVCLNVHMLMCRILYIIMFFS